ncbi:MAG: hypothetical protein WCF85_20610 [Rhodospirillaceae bacterium]
MTTTAEVGTLIIRIPVEFKRRGGRKLIITPEGAPQTVVPPVAIDETLVKILVKAHRWRRRIESGQAKSVTDLAEQEKVSISYVARLWPLTCLAPDIIAAILDGRQPRGFSVNRMLQNVPESWDEQRRLWEFPPPFDLGN